VSGFSFASATSSFMELALTDGCTSTNWCKSISWVTGASSLIGSYDIFLNRCGLLVIEESLVNSSV
jgi:hypothetical protein